MTISNVFVFGDSLSDTGNLFKLTGGLVPPAPFYFNGRFSNGPVAVEYLTNQLGPNVALQSFAVGGATTGVENSLSDDLGAVLPGLKTQLDAFSALATLGGIDKDGLYIVWAGPNDFLDFLDGKNIFDPALLLQNGSRNLANSAQTLHSLGATNIVLPNMINLGRIPFSKNFQAEATAITKAFNARVALDLDNLNFSVTEVDLFSTGEAIAQDPAAFKFSNITDPLLPLQFSANPPPNPQEFFFWDDLHPTTQGHAVFANTLYQTVTGVIPQPSFNHILGTDRKDRILGTANNDNIRGLWGDDILEGRTGNDRIQGGLGNDKLFGDQGDDILSGDDGHDSIWGGQGDDIGFGGDGNDVLFGLMGDDIMVGDGGNDLILGGIGNDYLLGGEGKDILWGNEGKDILNGGLGQDWLYGGTGDDLLDGGADNDSLTGGQGQDQFVYRSGSGRDIITDFRPGQDQLNLTSFGFLDFSGFIASVGLNNNTIDFGNGNALVLVNTNVFSLSGSDFIFA
jgi:Ca2+-binding RTX toxin-like protein